MDEGRSIKLNWCKLTIGADEEVKTCPKTMVYNRVLFSPAKTQQIRQPCNSPTEKPTRSVIIHRVTLKSSIFFIIHCIGKRDEQNFTKRQPPQVVLPESWLHLHVHVLLKMHCMCTCTDVNKVKKKMEPVLNNKKNANTQQLVQTIPCGTVFVLTLIVACALA